VIAPSDGARAAGWTAVLLAATLSAVAQTADPVGIWNLRIKVGNIGEGIRTVIVRVERKDGGLTAQATGVTAEFREVEELTFANGTLHFFAGAYEYSLAVTGDSLTGTVKSPAGTQTVAGTRQKTVGYDGDVPEVLRKTWTGVVGHRVDGVPPKDTDAVAWLTARVKSPDDLVIWQRRIAVGFVNAEVHRAALLAQAGRTVTIDGAWRRDRIEIAAVTPTPPK
jgi:hypothetical protein